MESDIEFLNQDEDGGDDEERRRKLLQSMSAQSPKPTDAAPPITAPSPPTPVATAPPAPTIPTAPALPVAAPNDIERVIPAPDVGGSAPTAGAPQIPSVGGPSPYAPPAMSTSGNGATVAPMPTGDAPPPPAPTNLAPPAAPSSGPPAGFTRGEGLDYGTFYYNGTRVMGFDDRGNVILDDPNRSRAPGGAALQQYIDSPAFQQVEKRGMLDQAGEWSTDPAMKALQSSEEYKRLAMAGKETDRSAMSPELQKLYDASSIGAYTQNPEKWMATHPNTGSPTVDGGPGRYLQGGQMFSDRGEATAASDWLKAHPGEAIAPQMPGGAYTDEVKAQMAGPITAGGGGPIGGTGIVGNPSPIPAVGAGIAGPAQTGNDGEPRQGFSPVGPRIPVDDSGNRPVPVRVAGLPGIPTVGGPGGSSSPGAPAVPTMTPIDPANDLRSQQINPSTSPILTNLNSLVSNAASAVGNGKSREQIANDTLDAFDLRAQPTIRDRQRAAAVRAASLGRVGMGDEGIEQLRPFTDYLTERAALSKDLASETATGEISDRLNRLSALSGVQGQQYGQDASGRNELRTERDYQTTSARQAMQDAIQEYLLEQQSQAQEFNQGSTLAGVGYGNSPANLYFGAGQQYGAQGAAAGANAGLDWSALASLIAPYLNRGG
jgi:hypothetical protein